jgi:hypothetical protein
MSDKTPETTEPETPETPETEPPEVIAHADDVEAYPCSTACAQLASD